VRDLDHDVMRFGWSNRLVLALGIRPALGVVLGLAVVLFLGLGGGFVVPATLLVPIPFGGVGSFLFGPALGVVERSLTFGEIATFGGIASLGAIARLCIAGALLPVGGLSAASSVFRGFSAVSLLGDVLGGHCGARR